MSISYTGADTVVVARPSDSRLLLALMTIDGLFACIAVFWWTLISFFIAEPIKWATWTGMSSRPELLEYPFSVLWMLPAAGIGGAWLAKKAGRLRLALALAFFPILLIGLVLGWYYLTPPHWR